MLLSAVGWEFQSVRALIVKVLSSFVTKCDLGVSSRAPAADPSGQEGT